jgi:hypothetical protein
MCLAFYFLITIAEPVSRCEHLFKINAMKVSPVVAKAVLWVRSPVTVHDWATFLLQDFYRTALASHSENIMKLSVHPGKCGERSLQTRIYAAVR